MSKHQKALLILRIFQNTRSNRVRQLARFMLLKIDLEDFS